MKTYEQPMEGNSFEYDGTNYDCKRAVRKDTESIIRQAEATHKDAFHRLYKTDSIKPEKVRLYVDEKESIVYAMIIYTIDYKVGSVSRTCCGNYYPVMNNTLCPHLFQGSICW